MASAQINQSPFPSGAAVSVYTRNGGRPLELATVPGQTLVATAVAGSGGSVALSGLTEGRKYWAVGQDTGGVWRWVAFRADEVIDGQITGQTAGKARREKVEQIVTALETGGPVQAVSFEGIDSTGASYSDSGIAAALTAAAGGRLVFKRGTYKFRAAWPTALLSSVAVVDLTDGATLDFSMVPVGQVAMLPWRGTDGAHTALTANVGAGGRTLTMGSTAAFHEGDVAMVGSNGVFDPAQTDSLVGEQVRVKRVVSSTQLLLETPLADGYLTADAAYVSVQSQPQQPQLWGGVVKGGGQASPAATATLASDITSGATTLVVNGDVSTWPTATGTVKIDGEYINYATRSGQTITVQTPFESVDGRGAFETTAAAHTAGATVYVGSNHMGVEFDRCFRPQIIRTRFVDCHERGFHFIDCWQPIAQAPWVRGSLRWGSGYATDFVGATQDGHITDLLVSACRHACTTGNIAGRPGIPRRNKVTRGTALWTYGDAWDTHAAAEEMTYEDCWSYQAGDSGFNIECPSAKIVRPHVFNPRLHGVTFHNETPRASKLRVESVEIVGAGQIGARIYSGSDVTHGPTQNEIVLDGGEIIASGQAAARVFAGYTWRWQSPKIRNLIVDLPTAGQHPIQVTKADDPEVSGVVVKGLPASTYAVLFDDTVRARALGVSVPGANATGTTCIYFQGTNSNGVVVGCTGSGALRGVHLSDTSTSMSVPVGSNDFSGCTTPYTPGAGAGNNFGRVGVGVQTLATDADFTLTPFTSPEQTIHTGTLTANRTGSISTANAVAGMKFRVSRSGGGAFTLTVPGKALSTGQWSEHTYSGSAWVLTAFGSL